MIKAIAFDLDDTLIDTSGLLVPLALRNVHDVLVQNGLKLSLDQFNQRRLSETHVRSHKEIYRGIITELGLDKNLSNQIYQQCYQLFYEPELPSPLPVMDHALDVLKHTQSKYPLYLVTSGEISAQKRKIAASQIESFFKQVFIVPSPEHTTKKDVFKKIIESEKIQAHELLSIGNRLSNEIRYAKEIGAQAFYLKYGDHAHEQPQDQFEIPDQTIFSLQDLIQKCLV